MKLKKLPIGIQTFSEIREENYIYIDKTDIAYNLIESYKYVFLSRPRRFGKSLFLDTLRNIFEAKKKYFKGLAIENKWDWGIPYPVINISFAKGRIESRKELDDRIIKILKENQKNLDLECEDKDDAAGCFSELIIKAREKYNQRVVVLIDEYDKPILDNITGNFSSKNESTFSSFEDTKTAEEIRNGLINFYSVIKGNDEFLRFAFLTGVSKFTKTSIFSGLNNITDISLNKKFGDICGYSQNDIETTFKPYFVGVDMKKIKQWYNGYNFLGNNMYNPFDILQFIGNDHTFRNYWFETGTPTFLMKLIKKNNYFLPRLSNLRVGEQLLNSFDIENLDIEVILYQSGYLTIEKVETFGIQTLYYLKIPNLEVQSSFNDQVVQLFQQDQTIKIDHQISIQESLSTQNFEKLKTSFQSIFSSIPYNNYTKNNIADYEGFYASVVYVYLQSLGLNIIGEDVTNKGRIDLTIIMENAIHILEFKVDETGGLKQIKDKNYHEKYLHINKDIYLICIEFDSKEKNISKMEWEKI